MEFSLAPEENDLRRRYRAFVEEHVLPVEADRSNWDAHENIAEAPLARLQAKAKQDGLWAPQVAEEYGGRALSTVGMAACYEEMNRSIFGPVCFNCAAPDDGNMWVLGKIGTEAQKKKFLEPIIDGSVRSAFAMTEPDGGCGSDPSLTYTTATRDGDTWRIHGRKWWTTGAGVAKHFIVIARTSDDTRKGLTAFLFHADQPGWEIVRRIPIMGPEEHGGHCELTFDGLEIPDENRLLEIGDGLKVTQIRLGKARLTHCMRWLGMAKRALEIGMDYVETRESFGSKLIDRESVQLQLAEAAMGIEIGRLLTMRAAWAIDRGDYAKKEISMAKIQVADTLHRAVDTALQLNGGRGYSTDTPLEWMYRYARQARLVDGASEVHKMVLCRTLRERGRDFWHWGLPDDV